MDKIEEIRDKNASHYDIGSECGAVGEMAYIAGFDAAMELNFKFMQWIRSSTIDLYAGDWYWKADEDLANPITDESLYDYWLENIDHRIFIQKI